jgi:hypothetical protein|uniref:Uncharacterized protein n=1 Tax=Mantoniella tinhauana virus 1 TaxID=3111543 RepID=A0AB38ZMF6_9VIRU
MKAKAYILNEITELLKSNRGFCDEECEQWVEENKSKQVYILLSIKKELSENKEYQDISCMRWFRE